MSRSTISTFQLFEAFPTQEVAREYLESRLWPNGPKCPVCQSGDRITTRTGGYYRCNACSEDFTIRTGTIFERSHVPLHKWVYSMYLLVGNPAQSDSMPRHQFNRRSARAANRARAVRAPGPGRPRSKKERCPCGAMTLKRALARAHHC
jgi:transposase-like protein